ncbi:sensor histidine kinase [Fodinibius sp. SL11]|uniref:sensor histidine kinase n=1 Tax=Fodinibius sp. SL11 TaxID=3425690 RepID=UPI003F8848A1
MRFYRILLDSKSIALMLLLFGYGWIIGSDFIAAELNDHAFSLLNIQILKGLLFVTIASAGVYTLLYLKDKSLEQGRRYTDSILETIDVAILVITEEGIIDNVNNAFVHIFEYDKKEVVGRHFSYLLSENNYERGFHDFQQLLEGQSFPNEEWVINDKTGNPISLVLNSEILQNDNEKFLILSAMDITDQKETQAKLEHSLAEKEVLLSEIHHRVKNNLAIVSGLMQLQIFEEDNPRLKEKLVAGLTRIQAIGSIHELIYQSNSLNELRFDKSLKQLVDNLIEVYDQLNTIDLDLNLSAITININQGVPASLIINELVTNTLQHAFTSDKNGLIAIELSENEDEMLTISISDNGTGLPDEFTTLSENDTLGFQLVDTLLKQLEAEHNIDSTEQGTKFSFSFKKTSKKGSSSIFEN